MTKMIRSFCALITILTLSTSLTQAQDTPYAYDIEVKLNGLSNVEVYLAYHFGDKQYMKDTTMLDANGVGRFTGEESLPGGIYLVVTPSRNYFEILVNEDQNFYIENDTTEFVKNFKSSGTLENEIFYQDIRFINGKGRERQQLSAKYDAETNEKKKEELRQQLIELDNAVKANRKTIMEKHPNTLYAKILAMLEEIEAPEYSDPEAPDSVVQLYRYNYVKDHYFDNINFADPRLLRTPILLQKVNVYLDKWISPAPDSIWKAVDYIIGQSKPNDETFRFWSINLLNRYANSKVMGHDAVYVDIVDKYYKNGDAYWLETADSMRIVGHANDIRNLLIGKTAPNLIIKGIDGKYYDIKKIPSEYLVLYFYSDECGHCKKETPKLVSAYDSLRTQYDIKVLAVDTEIEKENWEKFIKEYKMENFINGADIELQNYFRETYNIESTPQFYLLDKDRKIVGKRLNAETLPKLLEGLEKQKDLNGKDRVFDDNATMPK